ncbi:Gldg family protein [Chitinophaga sp. XS-30]|uniref:Gldg family protein n=1 Tax=Chitinophaga sp. XS-30 TaxID=2604421 RepID=UPI0011DD1931|nr:Gldg family protein [Chitinophaga sp. XS-30]QEH43357.1 ABC transporter permease subunit [Chitinophaga sp. XS-30]
MRTIFKIAKTELRILFYSPIAWFLMIVFLVQCSIVYFGVLESYARLQEISGTNLEWLTNMTEKIFLSRQGLFGNVMQNLFLYIPLLTMSLISRETGSGTIKLLYSSPITVREIVFGKYLAMMIYSLLLVAIVGIFTISGAFHINFPEKGMLMAAMLGFYLLLCAYSAIGLFMSCLTTYQVVAAICTFVMIGVLSYIGNLWQDIAFIRELTYFLSINGRTQNMLSGLITTKDVVYFLMIVYIFLGLSIFKLKAGMESRSAMVKSGRYISVIASALLIGYLSSLPGFIGYYDATSNKSRTLTPNAQKIIAELGDEPLEVTAYSNLLSRHWYFGSPTSYNQTLARWEPYMRFKPDIVLKTVSYYDSTLDDTRMLSGHAGKTLKEVAEQYAKSMDVDMADLKSPEEIRKIIDLRPELNRYVMQLRWKGKTTFLRVFDDQAAWPGETEVSAAFKRLLQANIPRIAFVSGHLERDINKMGDREYKALTNHSTFRNSLVNQGFDVQTLSLETQDIPTDIAALVIADPKLAPGDAAMARLQQYIDRGGNLLIAGEPGKQAILNPILQQLGVQMMEGQAVQESREFAPDFITADVTELAGTFSKNLGKRMADSPKVSMPGAAALSFSPNGAFDIQPLLMTDSRLTWNRKQKLDLEMTTNASATSETMQSAMAMPVMIAPVTATPERTLKKDPGTVTFSPANGDLKGPLPAMLSLKRQVGNKEQRIIVSGDADFMSNAELQRFNIRTVNFLFNTAVFSWLCYGEFPIETTRPDPKDTRVTVSLDQARHLKVLYLWALPGMLLIFASILLIRRKRK